MVPFRRSNYCCRRLFPPLSLLSCSCCPWAYWRAVKVPGAGIGRPGATGPGAMPARCLGVSLCGFSRAVALLAEKTAKIKGSGWAAKWLPVVIFVDSGSIVPIYAYKCSACGHEQDVLQKMSDPVLTDCPERSEEHTSELQSRG